VPFKHFKRVPTIWTLLHEGHSSTRAKLPIMNIFGSVEILGVKLVLYVSIHLMIKVSNPL
jgi:hypothetical protein